jgi:hypothetical protein
MTRKTFARVYALQLFQRDYVLGHQGNVCKEIMLRHQGKLLQRDKVLRNQGNCLQQDDVQQQLIQKVKSPNLWKSSPNCSQKRKHKVKVKKATSLSK